MSDSAERCNLCSDTPTIRTRRFIDGEIPWTSTHGFEGVTAEQLDEAHCADLKIEADEGVHFERAWLDPRGPAMGLLPVPPAPSKEAIMRIPRGAPGTP